jgi:transcriptional regulator with XRE-family HTH domain
MAAEALARCFGENIVVARRRADLSQEELGVRASLHRTEISKLERGLRLPRIDTLVKLAASLGQTPNDLLAGIHWTPGVAHPGSFGRVGDG